MDWKIIASPLITAVIGIIVAKYFREKPSLTTFYSHASSYRISLMEGYQVYSIKYSDFPIKMQLDKLGVSTIPLVIKHNNDIWIYGQDENFKRVLTKSLRPEIYGKNTFDNIIGKINNDLDKIYSDIQENKRHQQFWIINTHSVIVRNSGRFPLKNVRVGHAVLPSDYSVYPVTKFDVTNLPGGGSDICFPVLAPKEEISISYLYSAPTVAQNINSYVKSDEVLADYIKVGLTKITPIWRRNVGFVLSGIGFATILYLLFYFCEFLYLLKLKSLMCF